MASADVDWAGAADAQEKALKQMDGLSVDGGLGGRGLRKPLDAAEAGISVAERSLLQKVIRKSLVENKNDLEIQRKDPNCPLYSVKSFEALNLQPNLLKVKSYCQQFSNNEVLLNEGRVRDGFQCSQQNPGGLTRKIRESFAEQFLG